MNGSKNFDRWVLVGMVAIFALVTVGGMYVGNVQIAKFGESQFVLFSGALLILLNRELLGNGNGKNGNGGAPDPTQTQSAPKS